MPIQSLPDAINVLAYPGSVVDKAIAFFKNCTTLPPFASQSSTWLPQTGYLVGQLVYNSGILYVCTTAHTSTNSFDISKFTAITAGTSGTQPTIIASAGTTRTLAQGSNFYTIFQVTLDQASCALTHTGFTTADGFYRQMDVQIVGSSGKTITFTDTFTTMSAQQLPIAVTNGVTEYSIWTDGDGHMNISHGQRIRQFFWHPFRGNIATLSTDGPIPLGFDARICGGQWSVGTAPTGATIIGDYLKNGTSLYTGATGNRPTIGIGSTSSGSIILPASPILAPTDVLTQAILQVGSTVTGAELYARLDLLMAV